MRSNRLRPVRVALAAALGLLGCTPAPVTSPAPPAVAPLSPAGQAPILAPPVTAPGPVAVPECPQPVPVPALVPRFVAFTANSWLDGNLFLYDEAVQDVYVLNGALAGLPASYPGCTPFLAQGLDATYYGPGLVLFEFGGGIFSYDMNTEERVLLADDGLPWGAHPRISATGLLAYVNFRGQVTVKQELGGVYAVPRVLTQLAAEQVVQGAFVPGFPFFVPTCSLDLTPDGRWLVASLNGKLYLYDFAATHLYQLLPLDGLALGVAPGPIGHVAISPDGRLIAFTAAAGVRSRLMLLDRGTGLIDALPEANLGTGPFSSACSPRWLDGLLYFQVYTGLGMRVWRYDPTLNVISALVVLNHVLGTPGVSIGI